MLPLLPGLGFLLLLGWQGAAAAATQLCSSSPVNESAVCASVQSASPERLLQVARAQLSPCSVTFGQLACAQEIWFQDLRDDFLISLFSCLASEPPTAQDPEFSRIFFSKFDPQKLLASLRLFGQRVSVSQDWIPLFLSGLFQISGIGVPPELLLNPGIIPGIFRCLRAKGVSCEEFRLLVAALDGIYSQLSVEEQQEIYTGIKHFLTQDESRQKCYSEAVPSLNSTAWFRNFLGSFLEHATVEDLQLFGDEATLQKFARDAENLELVGRLRLLRDTAQYYTRLLSSAPGLPLHSFPDRLICYLSPGAMRNLSTEEILGVAQRLGRSCPWRRSRSRAGPALVWQGLPVASSLVGNLEDLSPAVLAALGQAALGLSVSQIQSIPGDSLESALPALARVRGWSPEQARAIGNKLLGSGYQILDGQSLAELGTLVGGLNSSTLWSLSPEIVVEAIQLPGFDQHLDTLPSALKSILVEKVASSITNTSELIKLIPNSLASSIPKSLLVFGEEKPNVQDLNTKPWTRDQAAMFFADVVKAEPDFDRLSGSVLQGFTCSAAGSVGAARFRALAEAVRSSRVRLGRDQLSCLLRMATLHGIPQDLDNYPQEFSLFLSPQDVAGSCRELLGAGRRRLRGALRCLKVPGAPTLAAALPGWLLSDLLSAASTSLGPPATWSAFTLSELSGLIPALGHEILQQIPKKVLTTWLRNFAWESPLSRKELGAIVEELQPRRHRREEGCPADLKITDAMLDDELMPTYYNPPELLRACLRNASLENHFSQIFTYSFSIPQLAVLKEYLDERYPHGYPDNLISNLGDLLDLVSPEDVSSWQISSADTLAAFLSYGPSDALASAVIQRYLGLGLALNATALGAIGTRYLCQLSATDLAAIHPPSLRLVSLNPSNCSQEAKNILYQKAKEAFSDQHRFPAYYELILPYLEGAPAADLKALSKHNVNMNVTTFVALRRDSLMLLTPSEVQGLLGMNLPDLAQWQNRAPVRDWIVQQKQSELDKLHVGLTGGTQEGYINLVTPKFPAPSSAPLGAVALPLLPALLLTVLTVTSLS